MDDSFQTIYVKHNMEVAHRLFEQPGKCQRIHGHSMHVKLSLRGHVNEQGIFAGIDFSDLKKLFRGHIDETYDHHLLLNTLDPYAHPVYAVAMADDGSYVKVNTDKQIFLPGLHSCLGDPTTENLAKWICEDMREAMHWKFTKEQCEMIYEIEVDITETGTNGATYRRDM